MPTIGSLNTSLTLESQQFMVGLRRAAEQTQTSVSKIERSFSQLKGAAAGLTGALALDAAIGAAGRALDYASSLGEVAQQLGVTTKDLQVYRFAATQVGVEQETMDKGLQKLTRTLGEAREGAKKPAAAFQELGRIIGRDIVAESRTAGDAIPLIAEALSKIQDPAKRARLEVALFGKAGQQLDTLLAGGRGQIDELRNAAERLGLVLSDQLIGQADEAADKLSLVKQVLEAQLSSAVASNADLITDLGNAFIFLADKAAAAARVVKQALGAGIENKLFEVNQKLQQNQRDRASGRVRSSFLGFDITRPATAQELAKSDAEFRSLVSERNSLLNLQRGAAEPSVPSNAGTFGGVASGGSSRSRGRKGGGGGAKRDEFADFLNDTRFLGRDFEPSGEVTFGTVNFAIDAETSDALRRIRDLTQGGVDLSISATSISEADKEAKEYLRNYEDELRRIDQDRVDRQDETTRELAGLYQTLFRDGTRGLWRDFKSIGLAVISEIAAKFMVATLAGKAFDLGGALTSSLTGLGFGGFFANGGSPPVGRVSVVGERGPELFVPRVPGRIIPNHALGGGTRVEIVDTTGLFETRVSRISAGVAAPIAQGVGRAAMVGGASLARRQAAQAASRRLGR